MAAVAVLVVVLPCVVVVVRPIDTVPSSTAD
jgi:hypothetical protein